MLETTQWLSLYTQFCFLLLMEENVAATGTGCLSNPCLNNGSCVLSNFRCVCPEDYAGQYCNIKCPLNCPHGAYEGFTSGFLSGMGAVLFLFFSVSCSMYLARKYEVHREERRRKEFSLTLQISERIDHN